MADLDTRSRQNGTSMSSPAVVDFSCQCAPVDSTAAHVMLHGVLYPEVHGYGLKNKKYTGTDAIDWTSGGRGQQDKTGEVSFS
jgi:hypothetical protein